ncbi:MAG: hypothetical protein HY721_22195 [Planctomycetes bacterium]|nr:hypothetical protein [Planctomycetota bacterium]
MSARVSTREIARRARRRVDEARRGDPARRTVWEGADRALGALERREAVLGDAAAGAVEGFLEAWSDGDMDAVLGRLAEQATASEVLDSMRRGARELEEDTRRRQARNAALLELARELGLDGVRLLLKVLLAA